ncbi:MAG: autotransporter domain-containing protein [Deltaproteobacteria bacterium]|nr:autotransporter domain-containing protein [Deltaproteobacteria bacterium]
MRKLLLAGLVLLSNLTMWSQATTAQIVNTSLARQTSRQISDAIQARITESQPAEVSAERPRNQVWFNFAHEYASFDEQGVDFSGHAYGPLIGVDSAISDFYLGLTFQYLRFNTELTEPFDLDLDANLYGIAPYVAWVVSDYFFVSLLAGYYAFEIDDIMAHRAEIIRFPRPCRTCPLPDPPFMIIPLPDAKTNVDTIHSGFYEIDFNAMLSRERLEVIVKAGFNHNFTKGLEGGLDPWAGVPPPFGPDPSEGLDGGFHHFYTFIAGGDVGYRIGTVKPYVRVWWEGEITDLDNDTNNDFTNTGFFGGGVTIDVTDRFTIGLNGWAAVGEEFDVITHGGLTLRYKF